MAEQPIKIDGLKELRKQLKAVDKDLPKAVRLASNEAAQIVVDEAKPRVPTKSGAAKKTVKAASTQNAARVAGGSKKVPYYGWLDFGGTITPANTITRPYRRKGRYIWSAYSDRHADVQKTLQEALLDVATGAGFEVTDDG